LETSRNRSVRINDTSDRPSTNQGGRRDRKETLSSPQLGKGYSVDENRRREEGTPQRNETQKKEREEGSRET
jgi:hypothetical protein